MFAAIMGTSSLILIIESIRKLITDPWGKPDAGMEELGALMNISSCLQGALPLGLVGGDIVMKIGLYLVCVRYSKTSLTAAALTQDHRNDIVLNATALVTAALGSHTWAPIDPIGAILIALWTGWSWGSTCYGML